MDPKRQSFDETDLTPVCEQSIVSTITLRKQIDVKQMNEHQQNKLSQDLANGGEHSVSSYLPPKTEEKICSNKPSNLISTDD